VDLREALLSVMNEYAGRPGYFQTESILKETAHRANVTGEEQEQALLTLWADMFRLGIIAPGLDLSSPSLPFCHLTEYGRRTLESLSRDPANPDGYLAALRATEALPAIAESYMEEAVATYNTACFKAAAVMVGGASETLVLGVRDSLLARISVHGRKPSTSLADWRVKVVFDAITKELTGHLNEMPVKLREAFQYTWPAFLQQIRAGRNEVGHPSSIAPITREAVHASLLIFPELAKLAVDLDSWVRNSML
jgi:hypothetical protein